jgi:predicted transcriptional regulator
MYLNEVRAMGQVTIYLEDEVEEKMSAAAKSEHLSKSKWVASLIKAKVATEWPESITQLAGAWKDLSFAEEGRANLGRDVEREEL